MNFLTIWFRSLQNRTKPGVLVRFLLLWWDTTTMATRVKENIKLGWLTVSVVQYIIIMTGPRRCAGKCGATVIAESPTSCRQQEINWNTKKSLSKKDLTVKHFLQQDHTYFNKATSPYSTTCFGGHFLSNHNIWQYKLESSTVLEAELNGKFRYRRGLPPEYRQ